MASYDQKGEIANVPRGPVNRKILEIPREVLSDMGKDYRLLFA